MKLTIHSRDLQKAFDQVSRLATQKVGNNVYAGILFRAENNVLEMQATDYQTGIRVSVPAQVEEAGEVVIMASYLPEMVKKFPDGAVKIMKKTENNMLSIRAGRSDNEVVIGMVSEFPRVENFEAAQQVTLPGDQLKEMYQQTQFAVASESQRPIFSGLLLEVNGERARMVATDTYRLVCREVGIGHDMGSNPGIIIPEKVLSDVVRLLPTDGAEPVEISWYRHKVAFRFSNVYFTSLLIEGQFPDYNRIFPSQFDARAVIDRREFTGALERASLLARDMSYKTVSLSWQPAQVDIHVTNAEAGSMEESVACEYEGEPLQIAFNCFYLLDILKRSTGDTVILHILRNGPMRVEQEEDKWYRYLVTPMRENSNAAN